MKKTLVSIILILALVMSSFVVFADKAPYTSDLARDFYASPYKDGVIISWNCSGWGWCELYMTPEGGEQGQLNRNSYSYNNAIQNNVFIDENASFSNGVTFENTPGKTYTFRVIGYINGGWESVVGSFTYTVPTTPTLSVAATDLTNTLTYALVNNGQDGAIYRYDSEAKAKIGGNDYDKKIDVTYGGDPVTDTVDAAGTYSYTIKQEGISDTPELIIFGFANNSINSEPVWDYFTVTEGENNSFTLTGTVNAAGIPSDANLNWTIAEVRGLVMATADHAGTAIIESGESYRFFKNVEGVTDVNGAIKILSGATFTLDGTTKFDNVTNEDSDSDKYPTKLQSSKLKRGEMYKIHLVSQVGSAWDNEAFGLIIPELTVVSATNTEPAPTPTEESWITNATVVGDGLVNLTFGNLGDDTSWSEIAIFIEDRGALDYGTISASILSRPGNHSVWGGHKEGTVGSNGQFAFELVDGTTYYVYVIRNVGGTWDDDHLMKPFSFTYTAPQATPEPTPVPTVTVVPDDDDNDTADLSVVLYAVTALAATGTVVAIKRKRK